MTAALTLLDTAVRQDADGRFCLNDLHRAAGGAKKHEPNRFLRLDTTKALINEISSSPDLGSLAPVNVVLGKGKAQGTYVCRELVYAYAMWISARFHLAVIRAFDAMQLQRVLQSPESWTRSMELDARNAESLAQASTGSLLLRARRKFLAWLRPAREAEQARIQLELFEATALPLAAPRGKPLHPRKGGA